jgi:hypothetical protein
MNQTLRIQGDPAFDSEEQMKMQEKVDEQQRLDND